MVPANEPKMVDLASCEAVAEDICKLIEAATIAVGEAEEVGGDRPRAGRDFVFGADGARAPRLPRRQARRGR